MITKCHREFQDRLNTKKKSGVILPLKSRMYDYNNEWQFHFIWVKSNKIFWKNCHIKFWKKKLKFIFFPRNLKNLDNDKKFYPI